MSSTEHSETSFEKIDEAEFRRATRIAADIFGEQTQTSFKKGRGRSKKTVALAEAMFEIAAAAQPITGRGIGYQLFTRKLISSMGRAEMQRVYRLLKEERESGNLPWAWVVDETRSLERVPTWNDAGDFAETMVSSYRRDSWNQQPHRVEVWSEKGTIRGVIDPVLDKYAVGFRVMHGFSSATTVYDVAQSDDGRPLIALYVGDYDPSGLFMSEADLPQRLKQYGGDHVELKRIALTGEQVLPLQSFPASDKRKDPRFRWFTGRYGEQCWELDALDPRELRSCVEKHIKELIEPVAWERCESVLKQERVSIHYVVTRWKKRLDNRRRAAQCGT
jgi:hypothetical protein